jgi:hypothetical protein
MELSVKRSFSAGDTRYRYELLRNGTPVKKVLSDNEYVYAVVTDKGTMELRRSVSDISDSEMADPDTRIIFINTVTP